MDRQSLLETFSDIEDKYGIPPGYLDQTAEIESGHNPRSHNELSGAKGMFQFVTGTAKEYGLKNPWDPVASADAAARYAAKNQTALRDALGRDPTAGELYLAHQQGTAGAVSLLSHPNARAIEVVPAKDITSNGGHQGMTAGQFANQWTGRFTDIDNLNRRLMTLSGGGDTSSKSTPWDQMTEAEKWAPKKARSIEEQKQAQLMAFAGKDDASGGGDWDSQFFGGGGGGGQVDRIMQRYQKGGGEKAAASGQGDIDRILSRYGRAPSGIAVEAKPVKTTMEATTDSAKETSRPSTDPLKDWASKEGKALIEKHPYLAAAGETAFDAAVGLGKGALYLKKNMGGNAGLAVAGGTGISLLQQAAKHKIMSGIGGISLLHKMGLDDTALKAAKTLMDLIP